MRRAPTRRPEWPGNEARESEGNSSSKGSLSHSNRQGRLEGCHRMSAATHLICGLESV